MPHPPASPPLRPAPLAICAPLSTAELCAEQCLSLGVGSRTDCYLLLCCLSLNRVHQRPQFPECVPVPAFAAVENIYLHFPPFLPTPATFEKISFSCCIAQHAVSGVSLACHVSLAFHSSCLPSALDLWKRKGHASTSQSPPSCLICSKHARHTCSRDGSGVRREHQRPRNTAAGPLASKPNCRLTVKPENALGGG